VALTAINFYNNQVKALLGVQDAILCSRGQLCYVTAAALPAGAPAFDECHSSLFLQQVQLLQLS
jgi:hypothetical protein